MSPRRLSIYAAIAANVAIALTKFIAAATTHSGAMFSEGIHSLVDTGDGLLLLLGLRLSKRPPTKKHVYGHGLEVYFWSMVVAMAIFGVGCGVSVYQGVHHLISGSHPETSLLAYLTLAAAFVFEGVSLILGFKSFRRIAGHRPLWEAIQRAKDPTTFVVVLEDSGALIGLLIAALGMTLTKWLGIPAFDSIASILIGLLLGAIAMILGRETWSLLLGESATPELVESVRKIAQEHSGIVEVKPPRTIHLGPDVVHVDLDVKIDTSLSADELIDTTQQIEEAVHEKHPVVHRVALRFVR